MNIPDKVDRVYPRKPEWKIIIENLVIYDLAMLFRICRKMIIHLERLKVHEILFYIEELMPSYNESASFTMVGQNWPKPKGMPFNAKAMINQVFDIADKYIPDDEIARLLRLWLNKEKLRKLSRTLERRNSTLIEIKDALEKYFELGGSKEFTSVDERIGVRVALISRFFSENLRYINIAKKYITLEAVEKLFKRVYGPAYGYGKVGGKSAGLILAELILKDKQKDNPILQKIKTPKSWFLTSDGVLEFINYNALDDFSFVKYQKLDEIKVEYQFLEYVFKNSPFPMEMLSSFKLILDDIKGKPIVVRSSSLLEDSFEASFTGKYKSLFIANKGTYEERLSSLVNAVAEVYASTFSPDAIQYRKEKGLIDFKEEMGILIQEVVGHKIGKYFMPSYAGVAFSNNEFRWSPRLKRDDGVIRIVMGMGTRAVDRTMDDYPILISPGQPDIRLNQTFKDSVRYSQHYVDVINLDNNDFETVKLETLIEETKGNIPAIEKMVSFNRGGTLVNPVSALNDFNGEDIVITFNNLVKNSDFIEVVREILKELSIAYNSPVDLEFASDGESFYLLQCRPQSKFSDENDVVIPTNISENDKIFAGFVHVSNAFISDIKYVVYVDPKAYKSLSSDEQMKEVANIVSKLNAKLPQRKFILMGPGRWGSKGDIKLGVPINYSDINHTAMLVELSVKDSDYVPELSFGTHFFQDLVEANIRYLPLYLEQNETLFNKQFFENTPNSITHFVDIDSTMQNVIKLINVDHFRRDSTINIIMDGEKSEALAFILKMK